MTKPPITVCILNHNYGHNLPQAIDSALHQQPGNYLLAEVLVIDDGSTDRSLEVCQSYSDRIRVVACAHRGFAATLTEGIRQARGEWVALLDADDWFAPTKLATTSQAITSHALLVQHWEHVVDADGSRLLASPHPGGNTSTLLVHREAAMTLLPVPNELFFHVFDQLGRGVRSSQPLTHYRVHEANMTDRATPGVWQDYLTQINTQLADRLRTLAAAPPPWATRRSLRRPRAANHTRHIRHSGGLHCLTLRR